VPISLSNGHRVSVERRRERRKQSFPYLPPRRVVIGVRTHGPIVAVDNCTDRIPPFRPFSQSIPDSAPGSGSEDDAAVRWSGRPCPGLEPNRRIHIMDARLSCDVFLLPGYSLRALWKRYPGSFRDSVVARARHQSNAQPYDKSRSMHCYRNFNSSSVNTPCLRSRHLRSV
jgi:hypothetical protein